ncbi:MAG: hypothetical protein ACJAWW_000870 [Sulfurimonas sp.]|jgi:hypothetical protein
MSKVSNQEMADFFKKANEELELMTEDQKDFSQKEFDSWKNTILSKLDNAYQIKMQRLNIYLTIDYEFGYLGVIPHNFYMVKTILRDMYFKYNTKKRKSKDNLEIEKLLKARELNIDFDLELAKMITGDNSKFPYRSSKYLTEFFYSLGHDFKHSNETRKDWVRDRLEELNIKEIHEVLTKGLFKRKYFIDYVEKENSDKKHEIELLDIDYYFKQAKIEFEKFIKNSINMHEVFDLSTVLDMSVNLELLFDNKADTKDNELNELIEEAKERFLSNDRQVGLEKLWDAYERLKTYYSTNKKESSQKIVNNISENFDDKFIDEEFKILTKIGNAYRIRHHEVGKNKLIQQHINYLFFRMLALIDLCLVLFNEEAENE